MNAEKLGSWMDQAQPIPIAFGFKVLGAVAVFIVGRWLIGTRLYPLEPAHAAGESQLPASSYA